jgi:hypothetical protein
VVGGPTRMEARYLVLRVLRQSLDGMAFVAFFPSGTVKTARATAGAFFHRYVPSRLIMGNSIKRWNG